MLRLKPALIVWGCMLVLFLGAVLLYASYGERFIVQVYELQQLSRAKAHGTLLAIVDYEDYLRVDPDSVRVRGLLVDAYIERRQFDKAVASAQECLEVVRGTESEHGALLLLVRAHLAAGEVDDAAGYASQGLLLHADSGEGQYGMARVHLARGEFDEMDSAYGRARELGSVQSTEEYAEAWSVGMERLSELQQESEEDAVGAERLYALGVEFEKLGRIDDAIALFTRAADHDGSHASATYWRAVELEREWETREAASKYREAAKGRGAHPFADYALERVRAGS